MVKGWSVIFILGGDAELGKADEALDSSGLQHEAKGWASDVLRPRPQVQVPPSEVERAWQVLREARVQHLEIRDQFAQE